MAGSRRWFGYKSDDGTQYAVQLDESTAEVAALGFQAIEAATMAAGRRIVRGNPIKMRYLIIATAVGTDYASRKVYVGAIDAPAWTSTSVTIDGVAYYVTYRHGERQSYIPPIDTAKVDGDEESNVVVGP